MLAFLNGTVSKEDFQTNHYIVLLNMDNDHMIDFMFVFHFLFVKFFVKKQIVSAVQIYSVSILHEKTEKRSFDKLI